MPVKKKPKATPQEVEAKKAAFVQKKQSQEQPTENLQPPEKPKQTRHRRTKAELDAARLQGSADQANALVPFLQMPFNSWHNTIKSAVKEEDYKLVEGLRLDDENARSMSQSLTNLLNYYFPQGLKPVWLLWIGTIGQAYMIMQVRLAIISTIRQKYGQPRKPVKQSPREQSSVDTRKTGVGQEFPHEVPTQQV